MSSMIINAVVSNNEDWKTIFQFKDIETDDLIDFTGSLIEIVVSSDGGCQLIEASTSNGKITIIDIGHFEMAVPKSEVIGLHPGSYRWDGVYSINDETIDLFSGTITVMMRASRL